MSNVETILESIEKLTLLEAAELVKAMEEKFGVSAAAPVAVAAAPAAAGAAAPADDPDAEVSVILASVPADKKIAVLKEVRNITGLGLKEAKDLVEAAPKAVKENIKTLGIKVTLSNKDASYEIIGNDNLEDGSIIKIEVKAKNDDINTYNIKITKEKEEKEINKDTKEEVKKDFLGIHIDFKNLDYKLIGIVVAGIISLIILIKIILKLRDRKLEKAIKKL